MVSFIKKLFLDHAKAPTSESPEASSHSLQLATAALLIEMMRADADVSEEELRAVTETVMQRFGLSLEESKELLRFADKRIRRATGYYEFTALINKGFTYEEKVKVVENLWEIAFIDNCLDKHEEHMVRKIADLIYVEHKDFIEAKLRVKQRLSP